MGGISARRSSACTPQCCRLGYQTALPRETYTAQFRERVQSFLAQVKVAVDEPVAVKVAELLKAKETVIRDLIQRAEKLAPALQAQSLDYVLCHADTMPATS